jgi:hypothetical protein
MTSRWLPLLLYALAAGLVVNAILGPLALEVIEYHYSETIRNQGIGLDAVALFVVAPLAIVAAELLRREQVLGAALAFAPTTFTLYMIPQYVIGPEYLELPGNNENFFALHFGMFVVAAAVFLVAWNEGLADAHPDLAPGRRRGAIAFLFAFPAFLAFALYLPGFADALAAEPERREYLDNPTAFWIVAFLDLAIAAPAAVAAGLALLRGSRWAVKALYAMVGWFALTPFAVAAMAIVMVANDDPYASMGRAIAFVVFAIVFSAFAAWLYWPVLQRGAKSGGSYAVAGRPTPR